METNALCTEISVEQITLRFLRILPSVFLSSAPDLSSSILYMVHRGVFSLFSATARVRRLCAMAMAVMPSVPSMQG